MRSRKFVVRAAALGLIVLFASSARADGPVEQVKISFPGFYFPADPRIRVLTVPTDSKIEIAGSAPVSCIPGGSSFDTIANCAYAFLLTDGIGFGSAQSGNVSYFVRQFGARKFLLDPRRNLAGQKGLPISVVPSSGTLTTFHEFFVSVMAPLKGVYVDSVQLQKTLSPAEYKDLIPCLGSGSETVFFLDGIDQFLESNRFRYTCRGVTRTLPWKAADGKSLIAIYSQNVPSED